MAETRPRQRRPFKVGGGIIRPSGAAPTTPAETAMPTVSPDATTEGNQVPTPPSRARLLTAAGLRVGGSLLSGPFTAGGALIGGPIGAGVGLGIAGAIGAGSELAAQAVEEGADEPSGLKFNQFDPNSLKRAGIEGILATLPSRLFQGTGKTTFDLVKSGALRSGGISGAGELMREHFTQDEVNPWKVAAVTGLGAATGGILAPFIGRRAPTSVPPTTPAINPTQTLRDLAVNRMSVNPATMENLTKWYRQQGIQSLDDVIARASELEKQGMAEAAHGLRMIALKEHKFHPDLVKTTVARLQAQQMNEEAYKLLDAVTQTASGDKVLYAQKTGLDAARASAAHAAERENEARRIRQAAEAQKQATQRAKQTLSERQLELVNRRIARLQDQGAKVTEGAQQTVRGVDPTTGEVLAHTTRITPKKASGGGDDAGVITDPSPTGPTTPGAPAGSAPTGLPRTAPELEAQYTAWLRGRPDTPANRAVYFGSILSQRMSAGDAPTPPPTAAPVPAAPASGLPVAAARPAPVAGANVVSPEMIAQAQDEVAQAERALQRATSTGGTAQDLLVSGNVLQAAQRKLDLLQQRAMGTAPEPPVIAPRDEIVLAPGEIKPIPAVVDPALPAVSENRSGELLARFGGTSAVPEPRDAVPMNRRVLDQVPRVGGRRATDPAAVVPDVAPTPAIAPAAQSADDLAARVAALEARPTPAASKPRTPRVSTQQMAPIGSKVPALIPEEILTAEEIESVAEPIVRQMYAEGAVAPDVGNELAERVVAAARAYRLAKAAGTSTPEQVREAGKALGTIGPVAETAGTIPVGYTRQVTERVNQALQEAAEAKYQAATARPPVTPEPEDLARLRIAEQATREPEPIVMVDELTRFNQARAEVQEILNDPNVPDEFKRMLQADLDSQSAEMSSRMIREGVEAPPVAAAVDDVAGAPPVTDVPQTGPSGLAVAQSDVPDTPETGAIAAEMMARLGLAAGGAAFGGAVSPEDPITGMALGAVGGFSAPTVLRMLGALRVDPADVPELKPIIKSDKSLAEFGKFLYHMAPHIQRFNYLASLEGVTANSVVGPYGATFFGALQKALAGDPRGAAALKAVVNPVRWGVDFVDTFRSGEGARVIREALDEDPLVRAEMTGGAINEMGKWLGPTVGEHARGTLQGPAQLMATGDLTARKFLMRHGFTEQEAREMTLTSEPWTRTMQRLVNLRRGPGDATLMSLMLPFVRTPANIMEQGALRTPGLGYAIQAMRKKAGAPDIPAYEQAVQQGLGAIVMYGSYVIGSNVNPDQARTIRKFVSNAAGPYSALASVGFAAGLANSRSRGQLGFMGGLGSQEMTREIEFALPLPTGEPLRQAHQYITGQNDTVPRGWYPGFVDEAKRWTGQETPRNRPRTRRKFRVGGSTGIQ